MKKVKFVIISGLPIILSLVGMLIMYLASNGTGHAYNIFKYIRVGMHDWGYIGVAILVGGLCIGLFRIYKAWF